MQRSSRTLFQFVCCLCVLGCFYPVSAQTKDPRELMQGAAEDYKNRQFDSSKQKLRQVLQIAPNYPEACIYMGLISYYDPNSSYLQAGEWWAKGILGGGKFPENDKEVGKIVPEVTRKLFVLGKKLSQQENYSDAWRCFDIVKTLGDSTYSVLLKEQFKFIDQTLKSKRGAQIKSLLEDGRKCIAEKDWRGAHYKFEEVKRLDPGNGEVKKSLLLIEGINKLKSQNFNEAMQHLKDFLTIDSSYVLALQCTLMVNQLVSADQERDKTIAMAKFQSGWQFADSIFSVADRDTLRKTLTARLEPFLTFIEGEREQIVSANAGKQYKNALKRVITLDSLATAYDAITGDSVKARLDLLTLRNHAQDGLEKDRKLALFKTAIGIFVFTVIVLIIFFKHQSLLLWLAEVCLQKKIYLFGYRLYKTLYRQFPSTRRQICQTLAENYLEIRNNDSAASIFAGIFPFECYPNRETDNSDCDAMTLQRAITRLQLQRRRLTEPQAEEISELHSEILRELGKKTERKVYVGFYDAYDPAEAGEVKADDYRVYHANILKLLQVNAWQDLTKIDDVLAETPRASIQKTEVPAQIKDIAAALRKYELADNAKDRLHFLTAGLNAIEAANQVAYAQLSGTEREIFSEIFLRWRGILAQEMDDWRGRANIVGKWMAEKLRMDQSNKIRLEIENRGMGLAEEIDISLSGTEFLTNGKQSQHLELLKAEEKAVMEFDVQLQFEKLRRQREIRIPFLITYSDSRKEVNRYEDAGTFGFFAPSYVAIKENPYIAGKPVKERRMFFGRSDVFDFIRRNIERNVILINGDRRTGKTSLLYQLAEPKAISPDYVFVLIDMMSIAGTNAAGMLLALMQETRRALVRFGVTLAEPVRERFSSDPYNAFNEYAEMIELVSGNKTIVLMFDEFENLQEKINRGQLTEEIFDYLRSIMEHKDFKFILIGTYRTEKLTSSYWSIFTQIAVRHSIGKLDLDSAKKLIVEPVKDYVQFDEFAIDRIIKLNSCHPYFIQVLCNFLIEHLITNRKNSVSASDVEDVIEETVTGCSSHLMDIYRSCTEDEKITLSAAAEICEEGGGVSRGQIEKKLRAAGHQWSETRLAEALAKTMERQVLKWDRESNAYGFDIDLVRRWIYKNKALNLLIREK